MPVERAVLPLAMWTATVVSAMPDRGAAGFCITPKPRNPTAAVFWWGTSLQFVIIYMRKWGIITRTKDRYVEAAGWKLGQGILGNSNPD